MSVEDGHHYYGHVGDVKDVNLGCYMATPFIVLILIIMVVTGTWPLLLLFAFWPGEKK